MKRHSLAPRLALAALIGLSHGTVLAQTASDPVAEAERLASVSYDNAQQATESAASAAPTPTPTLTEEEAKRYHEFRMTQQHDKLLFAALLGVTALLAHLVVLRNLPHTDNSSTNIVSATGLIYIVFGTIILVVIASTEAQLTASMGIMGAVAGYLFGKHQGSQDPPKGHGAGAGG
jgi:hypothetical protein